ncbi:putative cardiolipin-specific deacylase, mitochondrial, partial [Sesbania bispinosa]
MEQYGDSDFEAVKEGRDREKKNLGRQETCSGSDFTTKKEGCGGRKLAMEKQACNGSRMKGHGCDVFSFDSSLEVKMRDFAERKRNL